MAEQLGAGAVLVYSENPEVVGELLTVARELAARARAQVAAAAIGSDAGTLAEEARARGADQILMVPFPQAGSDTPETLAPALAEVVRAAAPAVVLIGATRSGAEVAARAGQLLQLPCVSNCTALELDDAGHLTVERRVYGGRFVARQRLVSGATRIATIPAKRFARAEKVDAPQAGVRELGVEVPPPRLRTVGTSPRSRSAVDITKAEVIVSAGRGVRQMEDLQLLESLAQRLGGVLAGTRPLTGDVDWLPVDRRIGLSGQTVKPNLYIACGVSGQIEHIVGMKSARTVVAINNDPKAPIHGEADYIVIGDLYEIVPALTRACSGAKGG